MSHPGLAREAGDPLAKRQGDPHAFFKTNVELAAKLLRVIWGVWRSGRPYTGGRAGAPAA